MATTDHDDATASDRRWWPVAFVALACVPLLVIAVIAARRVWFPAGDWALIELRVRDVGTGDTPLVGPYSRYGWNHPGGLLFWILAVPYRLAGSRSGALLIGAALINTASVALAGGLAWRRGRWPALLCLLPFALLLAEGLGAERLWDPWNPHVTVLALLVALLAAWCVVEGDDVIVPLALAASSFLVLSHVGYALVVASVGGFVVLVRIVRWRRGDHLGTRQRWVVPATLVVLAVCWIPVTVDQVAGTGNLGAIVDHFAGPTDETTAGPVEALQLVARQLGPNDSPWRGGPQPPMLSGAAEGRPLPHLILPVLAFGVTAAFAWRARRRPDVAAALRFQGVAGVAAMSATLSLARITGPMFDYLVRWWWAVAALWWASILWSAWCLVGPRQTPVVRRAFVALAACACVWASAAMVLQSSDMLVPEQRWQPPLAAVAPTITEALPGDQTVIVCQAGSRSGVLIDGVRLALERQGTPVAVPEWAASKFGDHRSEEIRIPERSVTIVSNDSIAAARRDPTFTEIAAWDPRTAEESADLRTSIDELDAILQAADADPELLGLLHDGANLNAAIGLPGIEEAALVHRDELLAEGEPLAVFTSAATDCDAATTFGRDP